MNFILGITKKMLPSWAYRRLVDDWDQGGLKKYFINTGWMLSARIATFFTSFLTMAIVARYLGPENLGKLSYAQSFVAILSVFASLGIDQIIYRDLVSHPDKKDEILGTAIFSKFVFGTITFFGTIGISVLLGTETLITVLVGIIAFTFVIGPIGTLGVLFQAQVQAKYLARWTIFIAFFMPALKLLIVYYDKGLLYFASLVILEALLSGIYSIYIYRTHFAGKISLLHFDLSIFTRLMKDAWPLLFASVSAYIYAKIDQVMILHYMDATAVGFYSAAVRIKEVWIFIPSIIIASLFPALVNAREKDRGTYIQRLRSLSILTLVITFALTLPLFIFSAQVIHLIFGTAFLPASSILKIYIWTAVGNVLLMLIKHYLIAENLTKIILISTTVGATVNIALNSLLIPLYGAQGAAYATLVTLGLVFITNLFFKRVRTTLLSVCCISRT